MNNRPMSNTTIHHSNMRKRLHAVSMQVVNDIDEQNVELHILTDRGESLVVSCSKHAIDVVNGAIGPRIDNSPNTSS